MKTFKRIPLPDHDYVFIVYLSGDASFKIICEYSNISQTPHDPLVYITPRVGRYLSECYPNFWSALDNENNVVAFLISIGFTETEFSAMDYKLAELLVH